MFAIRFDIYDDGDFRYEGNDIENEIVLGTFKEAMERLLFRLKKAYDTIAGKSYVVEDVKRHLKNVIESVEESISRGMKIGEFHTLNKFYYDFDCGNQSGDFGVYEVEVISTDKLITIKNIK